MWNGAVQQATSRGTLVDMTLSFEAKETLTPELAVKIAEAVGSPARRRIRSSCGSGKTALSFLACLRGILERSVALESAFICDAGLFGSYPWISSPTSDEKGARPLQKLKRLNILTVCPSLWEYLFESASSSRASSCGPGYRPDVLSITCTDPLVSSRLIKNVLDAIQGPQLLEMEYIRGKSTGKSKPRTVTSVTDPIQATFFDHPRRVVGISHLDFHTGITQASLSNLEEMYLDSPLSKPVNWIFRLRLPRLRHLDIDEFQGGDECLARAILAVSETLHSFVLTNWKPNAQGKGFVWPVVRVDQTLAAIGFVQSLKLRRLKLYRCKGITYAMFLPLLIGIHPSQPLWPNIRHVDIHGLCSQWGLDTNKAVVITEAEFTERLYISIKLRFPSNGFVDGMSVEHGQLVLIDCN
jgi:hypothetical protein